MRINKYLHIVLFFYLVLFSCNKKKYLKEFYPNGKLKILAEIDNDSVQNGIYEEYYKNGKIYLRTKYTDNSLNDSIFFYFSNGTLQKKGKLKDGKKISWWIYYDSIKKYRGDSIEYIIRNGKSFINQYYLFVNDKLQRNKSLFYELYIPDTLYTGNNKAAINYHANKNRFCIDFDSCRILKYKIIINYYRNGFKIRTDSFFNNKPTVQINLLFDKKGIYNLEGTIFEGLRLIGKKRTSHKWIETFFTKKVYVKDTLK